VRLKPLHITSAGEWSFNSPISGARRGWKLGVRAGQWIGTEVSQLGDILRGSPQINSNTPLSCDIGHKRLSMRETRPQSHTDALEGHLSVRKMSTDSQKEGLSSLAEGRLRQTYDRPAI
jgi:hypothetical protein